MRKLVVAICLLNVAVPKRDESRKGEANRKRKQLRSVDWVLSRAEGVSAEGSWTCLKHRKAILAEDKRCSCPSSWDTVNSSKIPVLQRLYAAFDEADNVTDYKPRTKWCNKLCRSRQLKNLFTPKTKERDNRKYGKPHVTKILFSAIWIHCPFILSDIW